MPKKAKKRSKGARRKTIATPYAPIEFLVHDEVIRCSMEMTPQAIKRVADIASEGQAICTAAQAVIDAGESEQAVAKAHADVASALRRDVEAALGESALARILDAAGCGRPPSREVEMAVLTSVVLGINDLLDDYRAPFMKVAHGTAGEPHAQTLPQA